MARNTRQLERLFFKPEDLSAVTARMSGLAVSEDGWINLLPTMTDEDADKPTSLGFLTLFGGGGSGMTMCTWIPASGDHDPQRRSSLGISHTTGRRAVPALLERDIAIPDGWSVEQDHPFRGLVLRVPVEEFDELIVTWALRAIRALGTPRPIKGWRADVYLPSPRR